VEELQAHVARRARLNPLVVVHDARCFLQRRTTGSTPAGATRGYGWILPRTLGSIVPRGQWYPTPREWRAATHPGRCVGFYDCDAESVAQIGLDAMVARRPCILAIDELDLLPPQLRERSALYRVIQHGRRTPVDVFGSARRPQAIDKGLLAETNLALVFSLRESRARAALERSGWPGAEQWASRLAALPPRQHYRVLCSADVLT